ncbi:MAG: AAA-like domain-containing protein, partial [Cyanobacteria bacterium J06649_4]
PFRYGSSISIGEFLNRRHTIIRVVGRILSGGQSSALVGQPRTEKTSTLLYLASLTLRQQLYGERSKDLIFSFVDSHMIGIGFTQAQFWEQVLRPLLFKIEASNAYARVRTQYENCRAANFSNFSLETLFRSLRRENLCFVLLIDEFDSLVNHQVLNCMEFFGGLRSFASRSDGALVLVIASRQSIHELNTQTQSINPASSPFFNIFKEFSLGSFSETDTKLLLQRAGDVFSEDDRQAIRLIAGRHPYLLQVAGSALWEAYEENLVEDARWSSMINSIYREQRSHFLDTWRIWSPAMKKAFTTIALCETEELLEGRTFLLEPFASSLNDMGPELRDLEAVGLIALNSESYAGWHIESKAMTWWLADELIKTIRSDQPFVNWLQAQEMESCLTNQEKENLVRLVSSVSTPLQQGAAKLIEAFSEGLGKGLAGSI